MSEAIASKEERLVAYNANIAAADKCIWKALNRWSQQRW